MVVTFGVCQLVDVPNTKACLFSVVNSTISCFMSKSDQISVGKTRNGVLISY